MSDLPTQMEGDAACVPASRRGGVLTMKIEDALRLADREYDSDLTGSPLFPKACSTLARALIAEQGHAAALDEQLAEANARADAAETLLAGAREYRASAEAIALMRHETISALRADLARVTAAEASARQEAEALRAALALSEVDVSLERTWCRICRTEDRSRERSRMGHPHTAVCILSAAALPPATVAAPTKENA